MPKQRRTLKGLGMERLVCSDAKTSLRREPLNTGGYTRDGQYFGRGEPLWAYDNGQSWGHLRASSRAAANPSSRRSAPSFDFRGNPMSKLPGSPTYRLRLHTGPLKEARRSVTRQLKRAKAGRVVSTGTEHVHIDVKANSCEDAQMRLAKALQKKGLKRLATQAWSTSCQRRPR